MEFGDFDFGTEFGEPVVMDGFVCIQDLRVWVVGSYDFLGFLGDLFGCCG